MLIYYTYVIYIFCISTYETPPCKSHNNEYIPQTKKKMCIEAAALLSLSSLVTGGCTCDIHSFLHASLHYHAVRGGGGPDLVVWVLSALSLVELLYSSLHFYWDMVETLQRIFCSLDTYPPVPIVGDNSTFPR